MENALDFIKEVDTSKLENLDTTVTNTVDNDLFYILSILEQLDKVVGKTFGPRSGYVATEMVDHNRKMSASEMRYTKDGQSTVEKMNFFIPTDLMVANEVVKLTGGIKTKSGDGSTTAIRLIYNLIKFAIYTNLYSSEVEKDKFYTRRINTPRVIKFILDKVTNQIDAYKSTALTYENIRNIGYISLNSDDELIKPIDDLINYLKENNTEINKDFRLSSILTATENTKLITRPGYRLSVDKFRIDRNAREMDDVKLIFLHDLLDLKKQIPIQELHKFAQSNAFKNSNNEPQKIIYVVSEIEQDVVDLISKYRQSAWQDSKTELRYDFIELDVIREFTKDKREDLNILLNTQEIYLNDYIELRHEVIGDEYDNASNRNLWKMKVIKTEEEITDAEGNKKVIEKRDHEEYRRKLFKALSIQLANGLPVKLFHAGDDDSLSLSIIGEDKDPTRLNNHIATLKQLAKSEEEKVRARAEVRLNNLNTNNHMIEIGAPVADRARLQTAYRDACMAINSSVKNGYHMGGSVSVLLAILTVYNEVYSKFKEHLTEKEYNYYDTALFILSILRESYTAIIKGLLPTELSVKEAFLTGYIDVANMKFGEDTVLSPVETDLETIRGGLALFSSFFSSLAIEFDNPQSALHAKNVSDNVKKKLLGEPKKQTIDNTDPTKEEVKEPVETLSPEEQEIQENFRREEERLNEMKRSMIGIGMANNVRPLEDRFTPRQSDPEAVDRVLKKYGTKQIGENVTISGYAGDPRNIGREIEEKRRLDEAKKERILAIQQRVNVGGNPQ